MRRYIFLSAFLMFAAIPVKAQDVYNFVLENATRIVNTPTSSFTQTRIAQFKRTVLVYMRGKAHEEHPDGVTHNFLNTQAYYLSEFVTLFFDELMKDKGRDEEARKKKILLFMDASISNPLFEDSDEETTYAYINEPEELTPFSLNTDWQKAYYAVMSQLKK